MMIPKTAGAFLLGAGLVAGMPATSDAAHRHSRSCGHRVEKSDTRYYGQRYDRDRYYDDRVDYDAPYVAHHGSGRYYDDDYGYRDHGYSGYRDYGYRDYRYRDNRYRRHSRSDYGPRYYGSRRVGYHYHGRSRCYSSHRPHVHFGIHLGF